MTLYSADDYDFDDVYDNDFPLGTTVTNCLQETQPQSTTAGSTRQFPRATPNVRQKSRPANHCADRAATVDQGTSVEESLSELSIGRDETGEHRRQTEDPLSVEVEQFYRKKSKLASGDMTAAKDLLWKIIETYREFVKHKEPELPCGEISLIGSVADGTKVCAADEFDVAIPLCFDDIERDFTVETPAKQVAAFRLREGRLKNLKGWAKAGVVDLKAYQEERGIVIRKPEEYKQDKDYTQRKTLKPKTDKLQRNANGENTPRFSEDPDVYDGWYLSPMELSTLCQKLIVRAVNSPFSRDRLPAGIKIELDETIHDSVCGPATTLNVSYGSIKFAIDCVPVVHSQDCRYVVKAVHAASFTVSGYRTTTSNSRFSDPLIYFKMTVTDFECELLQRGDELGAMKMVLMVFKTILRRNNQLQSPLIKSYLFKNLILQLAFEPGCRFKSVDSTPPRPWLELPLCDKFREVMVMFYQYLVFGEMRWHYDSDVYFNLESFDPCKFPKEEVRKERERLVAFLLPVIVAGTYDELLQ